MSKDIIYYAENVCGLNLTDKQKEILLTVQNSKDRGQKVFLSFGRTQGIATLRNTFYSYEVWLKDQKISDLEAKLAEKDKAIENWQTMYQSVVQTCGNDAKEIDRLNKQLADMEQEQVSEMKEHQEAMRVADQTITNLVEDNRASQEWYKKQLADKTQDKISFAVEKLTEIRDYVKNCWSLDTTEGKVRLDIAKKIRLKIEELKGNENE